MARFDNIRLIRPDEKFFKQYKDMMDEWNMEGSRIAPWPLHMKYHTEELFHEMLKRVEDVENGVNLGGFAPSTTYWLYDSDADVMIGASNLRHYLIGESGKMWGHIGYGIRPSKRRLGYAVELLRLTEREAKRMKMEEVFLGAYEGNTGSWKVMEKRGAKSEGIVIEEESGLPVKRYRIDLI